jgi:hypothetical protein
MNLPIPKHCRLPSLAELLRIDAEEERKVAERSSDPQADERKKHQQTELERIRERMNVKQAWTRQRK